jgi:hypothetical protein
MPFHVVSSGETADLPDRHSVSAARFGAGLATVTVRPGGARRSIVRASGQLNQHELSDPAPFQRFYEALSQALFLQVNEIE